MTKQEPNNRIKILLYFYSAIEWLENSANKPFQSPIFFIR